MLILKRNFILHFLNEVKCTLKSGTGKKTLTQHVAAKLANHLSGNLTFGVGSRAHN